MNTLASTPGDTLGMRHYEVEPLDLHAHQFAVTLHLPAPAHNQVLGLPVWIPGSYLVREFARHLHGLRAEQGGAACAVRALDKHRWQIECVAGQPLVLRYQVYAFDASVRAAWLDSQRGFFNGAAVCLYAEGQTPAPVRLTLHRPDRLPRNWMAASTLRPLALDAHGFGDYQADDYDELADSFVELGAFWQGDFQTAGVPHRLVVAGAPPAFDGERLLADTQRICETAIRFWHGQGQPVHARYLFQLNAVEGGYGGLEHRHGTALVCDRRDLPRRPAVAAGAGPAAPAPKPAAEGYETLLGLISHEYFHTWNVKRLRPAEFARYDYARENYTELLWFFEGVTSYYDDLLLRRAGLIDDAAYLRLLGRAINQVQQAPGRLVQSVAQASFDAWVKYYRTDENTPNATISYYSKGALVALALDLTLRGEGRATLDDVMRGLWQRSGGGPISEADIARELAAQGGRSFAGELAAWVHGTADLPLADLLATHGVKYLNEPAPLAQQLGLRVEETQGVRIKTVLRGGAAEQAGMAAGDEWLAVVALPTDANGHAAAGEGWRLRRLDDLRLYLGSTPTVEALVARDNRLLRLPLTVPTDGTVAKLVVSDAARLRGWLDDRPPDPHEPPAS